MSKNRLHRSGADDFPRPWEDRPVSYERWCRHRDLLMRSAGPGRRPDEWWIYDKGMERPKLDAQTGILLEMGELTKPELAQLMVWWRMDFENSLDDEPNDRREQLRGIPRPILAKLRAERRRRAKAVQALAAAAPVAGETT